MVGGQRLVVPPPEEVPAGQLLCYEEYVALMEACWAQDAAERPTFEAIVRDLQ